MTSGEALSREQAGKLLDLLDMFDCSPQEAEWVPIKNALRAYGKTWWPAVECDHCEASGEGGFGRCCPTCHGTGKRIIEQGE